MIEKSLWRGEERITLNKRLENSRFLENRGGSLQKSGK
jgi:hypothetical protein